MPLYAGKTRKEMKPDDGTDSDTTSSSNSIEGDSEGELTEPKY